MAHYEDCTDDECRCSDVMNSRFDIEESERKIEQAASALRKREYFRLGNIAGTYPYDAPGMVYVVISAVNTKAPLAIFDGDVWHLLSPVDVDLFASHHMNWVKRVIGTNDAYSEYPIESNATMNALLERLVK